MDACAGREQEVTEAKRCFAALVHTVLEPVPVFQFSTKPTLRFRSTVTEDHLVFRDHRIVSRVENVPRATELPHDKVVSPGTAYTPTMPEERDRRSGSY